MITSTCQWCGCEVRRNGNKPARFCSMNCKAAWQRTQKSVDRDWLYQKYVVEGMGTYQIGVLVKRNPKQVYHWLKGYGIPIREREWSTEPSNALYQQEEWLRHEYIDNKRTTSEIAEHFGVTNNNIQYYMDKFGIKGRTTSETRKNKRWGAPGAKNPMYGIRGDKHPNWRGGATPERQECYHSEEWARAVVVVWKRDKRTCQRCGLRYNRSVSFHIHHIVSFQIKELRTEPSNLVLLCVDCHRFVHSPANTEQLFIKEGGQHNG